jgi:molybdopterin-containing oxidoreductase family iron-sulfur binding subunit
MAKNNKKSNRSRRKFLNSGVLLGTGALLMPEVMSSCKKSDAKVKVLTQEGKLVEVNKEDISSCHGASREESHQGIPNRKFVMVIDLSKCRNARKCVELCQEAHHLMPGQEFIRVYLMQRSDKTAPYWFPKPCFHCNNPLCASVCPVGATYKRSDGIVLVDNERCIGCKFCMTGCPYNARIFIWEKHKNGQFEDDEKIEYSPETSIPLREGTVAKCDFCPDMLRQKKLPHCVTACPMGVIYFGDINEDSVTNGQETFSFSELIKNNDGYRYLDSLGTDPSVYYLPATSRLFPFERGLDDKDEELLKRYKNSPYFKNKNNG